MDKMCFVSQPASIKNEERAASYSSWFPSNAIRTSQPAAGNRNDSTKPQINTLPCQFTTNAREYKVPGKMLYTCAFSRKLPRNAKN